jgi:hypothetical protein
MRITGEIIERAAALTELYDDPCRMALGLAELAAKAGDDAERIRWTSTVGMLMRSEQLRAEL